MWSKNFSWYDTIINIVNINFSYIYIYYPDKRRPELFDIVVAQLMYTFNLYAEHTMFNICNYLFSDPSDPRPSPCLHFQNHITPNPELTLRLGQLSAQFASTKSKWGLSTQNGKKWFRLLSPLSIPWLKKICQKEFVPPVWRVCQLTTRLYW